MSDSLAGCFLLLVVSLVVFVNAALFYMGAIQQRRRARLEVAYARNVKKVGERLVKHSDETWNHLQESQKVFWEEFGREYGKATGRAFPKMPELPGTRPPPRGEA